MILSSFERLNYPLQMQIPLHQPDFLRQRVSLTLRQPRITKLSSPMLQPTLTKETRRPIEQVRIQGVGLSDLFWSISLFAL
ncbi:MAG: hypothetical protein KJ077_20140 [Anaerolineae bacterium]|nr:hypothetical protein [Anaerolineae bacterium]